MLTSKPKWDNNASVGNLKFKLSSACRGANMNVTLRVIVACVCILLMSTATAPIIAQSVATGSSLAVEHSVPFGTVSGKLLLLGNYLVFFDEQQPNASFVVARGVVESLKADGPEITVQTREPIRNRSGENNRLSFRVLPGADPAAVTSWYGGGATAAPNTGLTSAPAANAASVNTVSTQTYEVRHSHFVGDCRGRLIVSPTQVSYESVSTLSHSRRWEYQAIKETELSNPYELEIKPFDGETYKLRFDGSGMDPAGYKVLVDRITASRTVPKASSASPR